MSTNYIQTEIKSTFMTSISPLDCYAVGHLAVSHANHPPLLGNGSPSIFEENVSSFARAGSPTIDNVNVSSTSRAWVTYHANHPPLLGNGSPSIFEENVSSFDRGSPTIDNVNVSSTSRA